MNNYYKFLSIDDNVETTNRFLEAKSAEYDSFMEGVECANNGAVKDEQRVLAGDCLYDIGHDVGLDIIKRKMQEDNVYKPYHRGWRR